MNLNQIFTGLLGLGYERYQFDGDPLGVKITCRLFKAGEKDPTITTQASTAEGSIEAALRLAWRKKQ